MNHPWIAERLHTINASCSEANASDTPCRTFESEMIAAVRDGFPRPNRVTHGSTIAATRARLPLSITMS